MMVPKKEIHTYIVKAKVTIYRVSMATSHQHRQTDRLQTDPDRQTDEQKRPSPF